MATLAFAAPCLPGGADVARRITQEVQGTRRSDYEDFHRRVGLAGEAWYIQHTPQGDLSIVYLEGDDPARSLQALRQSDHPFDQWFKEQVKLVHGIDFGQPLAGPLPECLHDSVSRPARPSGVGGI